MSLNIPLVYKPAELIGILEALLPAAKKRDEKALAAHRKAEEEYLTLFKKACREALKWDYVTASKNHFEPRIGGNRYRYGPSCPASEVSRLERMISLVRHSKQKRFTISYGGKYSAIYNELTKDVPEQKKDMCK
jgi:hypothetical protein